MDTQKQKSWFGRNWAWVLPVGGCLTIIVLLVVGVGSVFFGISKMITNSEPYEHAIEVASNNATVVEYLGEHLETDGIMQGSLSYSNDDGEVSVRVPIKGTKGEGSLTIVGEKTDGVWDYETLYVTIKDTGEDVNLLEKSLEGI